MSYALDPATNLVVGTLVLLYLYRVIRWRPTTSDAGLEPRRNDASRVKD